MHAVRHRQQPSFNCFEFRWKVHTCMEMLERKVDNKSSTLTQGLAVLNRMSRITRFGPAATNI